MEEGSIMEKIIAIVNDDIVEKVLYIGVPDDIEKSEQEQYVKNQITVSCNALNISGDPVEIKDGEAHDGYELKGKKFVKRDEKEITVLFDDPEYGPVTRKIIFYSDMKGIEKRLKESFPGIKEFFILPNDQAEYIQSLPLEALDLSEPDITIK